MNAIDRALYEQMSNDANLSAAVTGIYNTEAPQGTAEPYITFQFITDAVEDTFSAIVENITYDVDIWAADMTTAGNILDLLRNALDWAELTISGYSFTYCRRVNVQKLTEPRSQGSGAHIVATYEVRAVK